jgi:hypothetical protein
MTGRADGASPRQLGSAQGLARICPASLSVGRGREGIVGALSHKTLLWEALHYRVCPAALEGEGLVWNWWERTWGLCRTPRKGKLGTAEM